jgi:IS5 family transposase
LSEALTQSERLRGVRPLVAIVDRGFKGNKKIDGTEILLPGRAGKDASAYEKLKARKRFRRRAGIEPRIGHLKSDFKLGRNYLKGVVGDSINLMLSASAYNFKKLLRKLRFIFSLLIMRIYGRHRRLKVFVYKYMALGWPKIVL